METPSPLDVVAQLVTAMNKCDLEMTLGLFEPGATFVVKPGIVVHGTSGIRQALAGFMALKLTLAIDAQQIVEAGDVAQQIGFVAEAVEMIDRLFDETLAWAREARTPAGARVLDTPWVQQNLARVRAGGASWASTSAHWPSLAA